MKTEARSKQRDYVYATIATAERDRKRAWKREGTRTWAATKVYLLFILFFLTIEGKVNGSLLFTCARSALFFDVYY